MKYFIACILQITLIGCNSHFSKKQADYITKVQVNFYPSFGENSSFILTNSSIQAVIEEDWRLSEKVDILHQFESANKVNLNGFSNLKVILNLDTNVYVSQSNGFDGLRMNSVIHYQSGDTLSISTKIGFVDSTDFKINHLILKNLLQAFKDDSITHEYLSEIYNERHLQKQISKTEVELENSPLHRLRKAMFNKYLGE